MGLPIMAFNPDGEPVDIVNHYVNFGWEYVYHCHILSHEEMDMMHAQVVGVEPPAPTFVSAVRSGNGRNQKVRGDLDGQLQERNGLRHRATAGPARPLPWTEIVTVPSDALTVGPGTGKRSYTDAPGRDNSQYEYQVYAINVVGDTWDYSNPCLSTTSRRAAAGPPDADLSPQCRWTRRRLLRAF